MKKLAAILLPGNKVTESHYKNGPLIQNKYNIISYWLFTQNLSNLIY